MMSLEVMQLSGFRALTAMTVMKECKGGELILYANGGQMFSFRAIPQNVIDIVPETCFSSGYPNVVTVTLAEPRVDPT